MTSKLYYEDLYRREFDAEVLQVTGRDGAWRVRLDRTAFYPEGGGQPSDIGVLGGVAVTHVFEQDGAIWHETAGPPPEGGQVHGEIDWPRRFALMQQHLSQHILSAFSVKCFGANTVGAHIRAEGCHIDLDKPLSEEQLDQLELCVNDAITRNLAVEILHPSREEAQRYARRAIPEISGPIRVVKVEGVDYIPCCGTHVARTGEIGTFKIFRCESYKGGARVFFSGGGAAMDRYRRLWRDAAAMGQLFSAAPEELPERLQRLWQAEKDLRQENYRLRTRLAGLLAQDLLRGAERMGDYRVVAHECGETTQTELRELCASLTGQSGTAIALLGGVTPKGAALAFGCKAPPPGAPMQALLRECLPLIDGRGGGGPDFAQALGPKPGGIAAALELARKSLTDALAGD